MALTLFQLKIKGLDDASELMGHPNLSSKPNDSPKRPITRTLSLYSPKSINFQIVTANHSILPVITVGVFGWMPDLQPFMKVCASLLKSGGVLLVEELHPILGMYEEGEPSFIDSSYFNTTPFSDTNGLDYFNYEKYDAVENYFFHHSLEQIMMAANDNGLALQHIKELSYNVGNFCADLEFTDNNPPLGINISWCKSS